MIKGLRRLRSGGDKRPPRLETRETKSEIAVAPPKHIIKALYDYTAQTDDELSFCKNDFLYVVEEQQPHPEWYMACDPLKNSVGLVPASYFDVIQRQEAIPSVSLSTALQKQVESEQGLDPSARSVTAPHTRTASVATSDHTGQMVSPHSGWSSKKTSGPQLAIYGLVLYDFTAERNDELGAKAGESIIIIAQSTDEWFVAKPIGRLGGPGLIPVLYVELREVGTDRVLTDIPSAVRRAGVPQVEEWKRRAAEYKASSIPLGRFDDSWRAQGHTQPQSQHPKGVVHTSAYPTYSEHSAGSTGAFNGAAHPTAANARTSRGYSGPSGASAQQAAQVYVTEASVDRFAINGGRYWYLLSVKLSNGKYRNLCRYYQDFYDFQIKLLDEFPVEAGRTGEPRTLPYMPGPLALVSHAISSQRRANLDDYVRNLVHMAPHISQCPLVQELFALRPGDVESDTRTNTMPQPPEEAPDRHQLEKISNDGPGVSPEGEPLGDVAPRGPSDPAIAMHMPMPPQQPTAATHKDSWPSVVKSVNSSSTTLPPPVTSYTHHNGSTSSLAGTARRDHIKIKVFYDGELIAIRIPATLPFADLHDRIATRLGTNNPELYKGSDFSGPVINSEQAFQNALAGENKIVLYAK